MHRFTIGCRRPPLQGAKSRFGHWCLQMMIINCSNLILHPSTYNYCIWPFDLVAAFLARLLLFADWTCVCKLFFNDTKPANWIEFEQQHTQIRTELVYPDPYRVLPVLRHHRMDIPSTRSDRLHHWNWIPLHLVNRLRKQTILKRLVICLLARLYRRIGRRWSLFLVDCTIRSFPPILRQ